MNLLPTEIKRSMTFEVNMLLRRNMTNYFRNKTLFYSRLLLYIVNTLIIMSFYFAVGKEENINHFYTNFSGFVFNTVNNFFINGMYTAIYSIPALKNMLKREFPTKVYSFTSFYIALIIYFIVQTLIYSSVYTLPLYFSTYLKQGGMNFALQFFCNCLNYFIGISYGLLLSSILPEKAIFPIVPWVFILFMVGSGYYRDNNTFPTWFKFLNCLSPYKYLIGINMLNQQNHNKIIDNMIMTLGYDDNIITPVVIMIVYAVLVTYLGFKMLKKKFK